MPATSQNKVEPQKRSRRTQAERSAETKHLLLEATIECLLEQGYVATSTTAIAARAGVSRGAQIHHYPKKLDLIEAAFIHVAQEARNELAQLLAELPTNYDPAEAVVDLLWKRYQGRYFWAYMELVIAARTDESLKRMLIGLDDELETVVEDFATKLFGDDANANKRLMQAISMSIRFMTGLALAAIVRDKNWRKRSMQSWSEMIVPMIRQSLK